MGDPRRLRKKYESTRKEWDKERIERDDKLRTFYGLKNSREIRKLETLISKKRGQAKKLLAMQKGIREDKEIQLMNSINKIGLLDEGSNAEDVLSLSVEELMERRLATQVWRRNLALTTKQARQFIVHGHIGVNGKKVTAPGYLLRRGEEEKIAYYGETMNIEIPKKDSKEELKKKFEEVKEAEKATAEKSETEETKKFDKETAATEEENKTEVEKIEDAEKASKETAAEAAKVLPMSDVK